MLGEEARDLHDHGGYLHARLRLLQRPDRTAGPLDPDEPVHVAEATAKLGLAHVVVTSVDRDDLDDGGAAHFAAVIRAIRARCPETTIEVLTPDFLRKDGAVETVVAAKPDVFNHNLETVPSKYLTVRPGARYFASIRLLQRVKELDPAMFTKSGIMVGLGEERNEVLQVMDDLRAADVDFLTIGQYLQPTRKHHAVMRFVPPEEFKAYETIAYAKGFLMVSASPLTRSSHHAGEDFARLKAARDSAPALRMPQFSTTRRVRHAAADMFDLVADVERYPEFVPLCRALKVRKRIPEPEGVEVLIADMTVAYKLVRETFTSRVTLDHPNFADSGRVSRRPVQPARESLDLPPGRRACLRCRIFSSPTSSAAARSACSWARCSTSPSAVSPRLRAPGGCDLSRVSSA